MSSILHYGPHSLTLLPQGAVWDADSRSLILSDLHLGKTGIFQHAGLALPEGADADTLAKLSRLCTDLQPLQLLICGDLLHARSAGTEPALEMLQNWQHQHPLPQWIIIPGNHDRRVPWGQWLPWATILPEGSLCGPWQLFHHPPEIPALPDTLRICGHLHPGIALGHARMSKLKAKCFWLRDQTLVLPAFGSFTGADPIARQLGDSAWVINADRVVKLPALS
jgi:uncharacterized protein